MSSAFHSWFLDGMVTAFQDPRKLVREHLGRLQVGDAIDSVQPLNVLTSGFSWAERSTKGILAAICSRNMERHILIYMEPDNSGECQDQDGWIVVTDEITNKGDFYAYGYDFTQWRVYVPAINFDKVFVAKMIQEMMKTIGKQVYAVKFQDA